MRKISLDHLERRHLDAPEYVSTNQGIKLYAEEAREELLNLIEVVRELDGNFRALAQASQKASKELEHLYQIAEHHPRKQLWGPDEDVMAELKEALDAVGEEGRN